MFETVKLIRKVSNLEDYLIGHPLRINQSLHMYHHIKNHLKSCVPHSSLKLNPSKIYLFIHSHSNSKKTEANISLCFKKLKNKRNNENLSENNSRNGECSKEGISVNEPKLASFYTQFL